MKKSKIAVLLICCLLLVFGTAMGTLAVLKSSRQDHNTFSLGQVHITLTETDEDGDGQNRYEMTEPGQTIVKDPKVTVTSGSEACYVFVKIETSSDFSKYLSYQVADGWSLVSAEGGDLYYRYVPQDAIGTEGVTYSVLKDNQLYTTSEVNTAYLRYLTESTAPQMTVSAAAVQSEGFYGTGETADEAALAAWNALKAQLSGNP